MYCILFTSNIPHLCTYCNNEKDYRLIADGSTDGCSVSVKDTQIATYKYQQRYLNCKQKAFSDIPCYSDNDCSGYSCDLFSLICLVPSRIQELIFVQCVVESMDGSQIVYLKQSLGISNITDISTLANYTFNILQGNNSDCVASKNWSFTVFSYFNLEHGLNLQVRSKQQNLILDARCIQAYPCPTMFCEDKSCLLSDNACVNWCKNKGLVWISYPSSERYS